MKKMTFNNLKNSNFARFIAPYQAHYLVFTLIFSSLAGCMASSPLQNSNEETHASSLPMKVVTAAGASKGLRDISQKELEELSQQSSHLENNVKSRNTISLGIAVGHSQNLLKPPRGFSNWGAAGMSVLGILSRPALRDNQINKLIVFMPSELATDERDAQLKIGNTLEAAVIKALPEEYSGKVFEWMDLSTIGITSWHRVIKVDGPHCENWGCVIEGPFPSIEGENRSGRVALRQKPDFIISTSNESYSYEKFSYTYLRKIVEEYNEKGTVIGHWHKIKTAPLKEFDHGSWYIGISEYLPEWGYMYIARTPKESPFGLFEFPVVLNKGQPLYFITP